MKIRTILLTTIAISSAMLTSCSSQNLGEEKTQKHNGKNFGLTSTTEILLTSEAGNKMAVLQNQPFSAGHSAGTRVVIRPNIIKQTISGIGTSFT